MTNCVHDWDFAPENETALFICLKCGVRYFSTDVLNRLNMLESDLANERALYADKQAELAARDALVERLVEAE